MGKLSDRQKKQIIAEYINGGGAVSQRTLAARYHVTQKTISKILNAPDVQEMVSKEKESNSKSMLEFLESQRITVQGIMQAILDGAVDDLNKASLRDKMGALKILSDVFCGKNGNDESGESGTVKVIVEKRVENLSDGAPDD